MLANCNRVATAALPEATSDLRAYASTLRTLRAELADLHRRIQLIRDALAARYPHAFPPPRACFALTAGFSTAFRLDYEFTHLDSEIYNMYSRENLDLGI